MPEGAEKLRRRDDHQPVIAMLVARLVEVVPDALGKELDGVLDGAGRLARALRAAGAVLAGLRVTGELALVQPALGIYEVFDLNKVLLPVRNLQHSGAGGIRG